MPPLTRPIVLSTNVLGAIPSAHSRPIVPNKLSSGATTTDATSYTASIVPMQANSLIAAAIMSRRNPAGNIPTMTGNNVTWTQIATENIFFANFKLTVFYAQSPFLQAGLATFDFAGQTQQDIDWSIVEFMNVQNVGLPSPYVQSILAKDDTGAPGSSLTLTFAKPFRNNIRNVTFGAFIIDGTSTITPGPGFSQLDNQSSGARLVTLWRPGGRSDNQVRCDFGAAAHSIGIAIEIPAEPVYAGPSFGRVSA